MTKMQRESLEKRLEELKKDLNRMNEQAEWNDSLSIIDDIHDTICRIDEIEMKLMEEMKMTNFKELKKRVELHRATSAWGRGVKAYAIDLLDNLEEGIRDDWFNDDDILAPNLLRKKLLDGAMDWLAYSEGGCTLVYDGDIAERLCTPSGLKEKKGGRLQPNSRETWIELQARALKQAASIIMRKAILISKNIEE